MVRMLVTINISKGWKTWSEMAKSLEPQMNEQGAKMIWAGANPDETAVFVLAEAKDPSFVKTFGERPDIVNRYLRLPPAPAAFLLQKWRG